MSTETEEILTAAGGSGADAGATGAAGAAPAEEAEIQESLAAIEAALAALEEGFTDKKIEAFDNLVNGLSDNFNKVNTVVEDRLNISRSCILILALLILAVIFKEEIMKSKFMKSILK
jgi:hypothetical protein